MIRRIHQRANQRTPASASSRLFSGKETAPRLQEHHSRARHMDRARVLPFHVPRLSRKILQVRRRFPRAPRTGSHGTIWGKGRGDRPIRLRSGQALNRHGPAAAAVNRRHLNPLATANKQSLAGLTKRSQYG